MTQEWATNNIHSPRYWLRRETELRFVLRRCITCFVRHLAALCSFKRSDPSEQRRGLWSRISSWPRGQRRLFMTMVNGTWCSASSSAAVALEAVAYILLPALVDRQCQEAHGVGSSKTKTSLNRSGFWRTWPTDRTLSAKLVVSVGRFNTCAMRWVSRCMKVYRKLSRLTRPSVRCAAALHRAFAVLNLTWNADPVCPFPGIWD